jgi:hypothetical protein
MKRWLEDPSGGPYLFTQSCSAVATLHNFCIDVGDTHIRTRADRDNREGDIDLILTNYNDAQTARIEGRTRRNELKQAVERAGVERPSTNLNSRA